AFVCAWEEHEERYTSIRRAKIQSVHVPVSRPLILAFVSLCQQPALYLHSQSAEQYDSLPPAIQRYHDFSCLYILGSISHEHGWLHGAGHKSVPAPSSFPDEAK